MQIEPLTIPDVKRVRFRRFGDQRGWFSETYRREAFAEAGMTDEFAQDNQSFSAARFTIRGLHFQKQPRAQAKLIRVLSGRILDVAVDLRRSSPHYGRPVAVELDAEANEALFVPRGFAHGFCTLTENVTVFYKVSDIYAPETEGGVLWSDPALDIGWPMKEHEATVSDRDRAWPGLESFESPFS